MGRIVRKTRQEARHYWMPLSALVLLFAMVLVVAGVIQYPRQSAHAASADWPTFLGGNARTGFNGQETTINPQTAPNLKLLWTAQSNAHLSGEPVEANGLVYWGDWNGVEHATNPSTGKEVWATSLGSKPGPCTPVYGVTGSATFASVSINGMTTPVVFVSGGTIKLYALNANTGVILWQRSLGTASDQSIFGSTAVFNGSVYIGVASDIDCPLVQGQLVQVDASSGAVQHVFGVVPGGCIGGGVWGSPTIDEATGMLYFGTGNGGKCSKPEPYTQAIVELNASTLSLVGSWQVPSSDSVVDGDYGSTPTLFQATIQGASYAMVGLTNKDGYYYAFDRTKVSTGALWKVRISLGGSSPETGNGSISSSAYDGSTLYVAGGITTINGQKCAGSVRAMDPNTGNFIWQVCLSNTVLGPVVSVAGLVVVGWANNMYVLDSATGNKLYSYVDTASSAKFWGAATISNGVLYDGSRSGRLFAFGLLTAPTPTPSPSVTASPSVTPSTTPGTTLAQDSFVRPNQLHWGTASDGQSWGADANTLSNFSISANSGQVLGSGTNARSYNVVLGPTATNAEALLSGSLSSYGSNDLGAVLHWSNGSNFYRASINGKTLTVMKKVGGSLTKLGSVTFAAKTGTVYSIRFRVVGSTLTAKAWAIGTTEPSGWMVTASDSSLTVGNCGMVLYLANGVTAKITSFLATSAS